MPKQKVDNVSIIKDFYTIEDEKGNKIYDVEDFL
jgi:hypothetical protein